MACVGINVCSVGVIGIGENVTRIDVKKSPTLFAVSLVPLVSSSNVDILSKLVAVMIL